MTKIPTEVSAVFDQMPKEARDTLLKVRNFILEVAQDNPHIGPVEETLRWGEPAYITVNKKTGSTLRLGVERASGHPALFFNCKTKLVEQFRQQFGDDLRYSKNRAVLIDTDVDGIAQELQTCIAAALSYHLRTAQAG